MFSSIVNDYKVLLDPLISPYQLLSHRVKADMEAGTMKEYCRVTHNILDNGPF